jgi:hypothetical protein
MKTKLVTLACICTGLFAQANVTEENIWKLMNRDAMSVGIFNGAENIPGRQEILLDMPFNSASWKTNAKNKIPKDAIVESIELVSTTYALNTDFDQEKLDRSRLHELLSLFPALEENDLTEWKRIHETNAKSPEEGRTCFHGFVIICRKPPSEASMKEEIENMESIFYPEKKKEKMDTKKPGPKVNDGMVTIKREAGKDTIVHLEGFIYSEAKSDFAVYKSEKIKPASIRTDAWIPSIALPVYQGWNDTTVTAVLNRNKQWKEMLVVCDITGSMSPYTSQLLAWFKLNTTNGRTKNFVFFNDGDMKSDFEKVAGSCGGLYGCRAWQFDTVMATAMNAMRHGNGGDAPENNVEATIYGLKNYGDAKEIVMIADNWATPRDLALADQVTRPVRIIVCGGAYGINPAYLDLARKTGGSVHTMEQDLTDLATMHEGETITIGAFKYKLEGGKFIKLTGS